MRNPSRLLPFQPSAKRGMALVLVLSCLTLLSILVLAFLSSISTEVDSSSSYANSGDVKQRSQTAINMVIAQIQDATSSSSIAWASQPGLIRTFNTSGAADKSYKLYSSGTMVADAAFDPSTANTEVPTDWKTRPSEYTDLNQPMLVSDTTGTFTKEGIKYTPNYPILDPGALGTVKGFSINNGTTPPDYGTIDPLTNNPAPMPVQWLYMLKNGSLRAIDPVTGKVPDASKDNPIVSRIAFWTDDDTCKVNINTAAGDEWLDTSNPGTFMDMPRANNAFENKLRTTQPVFHEYQRYPGHPATTYLTAVFPALTRVQIGDIVPRVKAGGSQGGSVTTYTGNTASVAALPLSDGMPLYASVDELRYVRSTSAATVRANQDTLFTPQDIERAKFFLTAHSRAPEVNLFNQPRISMWPQPVNPTQRTALDRAIAFCSTIAGQAFYFTRSDSTSPTVDYTSSPRNQALYAYLQNLTGQNIPGYGDSFLNKYPSPGSGKPSERDQILTEIFDYIRSSINLVDGQTGATVYAGPKLNDMKTWAMGGPGQVVPLQIGDTMGFGRTETLYEPILHIISNQTDVDPLALSKYDTGTTPDGILTGPPEKSSFARLFTRKIQVAILFNTFSVAHGPSRFVPNVYFEVEGLDSLEVNGQKLDFGGNVQSTLYGTHAPNHEYAWGSISTFASLFWQRPPTPYTAAVQKTWGTDPKTQYPFISKSLNLIGDVEAKSPLTLKSGNMKLNIYAATGSGPSVPGDTKGELIQTINFKFPDTTIPTPYLYYDNEGEPVDPANPSGAKKPNSSPRVKSATLAETAYIPPYNPSIYSYGPDAATMLFTSYWESGYYNPGIIKSVTRGLGAGGIKGDLRLVQAKKNVPDTFFAPLPGYSSQSAVITPALVPPVGGPPAPKYKYNFQYLISTDTDPTNTKSDGMISGSERVGNTGDKGPTYAGDLVTGVTYPKHVTNAPYAYNLGPAVSWGVTAATLKDKNGVDAPGDWDAGMGSLPDGPFINKADEGEVGNAAYSSYDYSGSNGTLFSPNRQVPSPVILGSLSTGVVREKPWQTLLFCPNPPAKDKHPGTVSPPDHLFLDLFTMPVVEPYPISEPFSTAGKINMNYQIAPFTYIKRTTGLQAVLRSTRLMAIPTADGVKSKFSTASSPSNPNPYRLVLNIDKTLDGFENRFTQNKPFKSASEICEMFLVPKGTDPATGNPISASLTYTSMATWWDNFKLTGDNLRETPYSMLYSRLTTKSNTYTVHVRVQTLKKAGTQPDEWKEGTDKVVGEYRGSYGIERYLDPNLASYTLGTPLTAYKFRTLTTKQFTP